MGTTDASWFVATPAGRAGPVGVIGLSAPDVDPVLDRLGIARVPVGDVRRRTLLGIDDGVVARWAPGRADLMPHGGTRIVQRLGEALSERGIRPLQNPDSFILFPEAADEVEARALEACARAASPRAVDLLLDQARRWREAGGGPRELADGGALGRLIEPALVAAFGPANVGKSSLMNALAGRTVAAVADLPGTTRDHVGVLLELDGVVVRYVDTPGVTARAGSAADADAQAIAARVLAEADLLLCCFDRTERPVEPPAQRPAQRPALRVAMRRDLGVPDEPFGVAVSARTGEGIAELARAVRERLVPDAALRDPRPWRFWGG